MGRSAVFPPMEPVTVTRLRMVMSDPAPSPQRMDCAVEHRCVSWKPAGVIAMPIFPPPRFAMDWMTIVMASLTKGFRVAVVRN